MNIELTFLGVFGAGALSFLSPCVLPLVPPYLCYMAGVSVEDFRNNNIQKVDSEKLLALLLAALCFVLGFTTVFVALGAVATTVGTFLRAYQDWLAIAAGIVIILMGLNFLGVLRVSLFSREARFQTRNVPASPLGAYIMGLAFAFGWTPCIGPILGPILTVAGSKETAMEGAQLLAVYSLGLGIPFLLAGLFSGAFMIFLGKFRTFLGVVEKIIGILLIVTGIMFLTGQMQSLSFWLLETRPELANIEGMSWSEIGNLLLDMIKNLFK